MIPPLAERLAYAEANVDELERAAHNYARSTHPESVPTRAHAWKRQRCGPASPKRYAPNSKPLGGCRDDADVDTR
jgi:hypothetical protein